MAVLVVVAAQVPLAVWMLLLLLLYVVSWSIHSVLYRSVRIYSADMYWCMKQRVATLHSCMTTPTQLDGTATNAVRWEDMCAMLTACGDSQLQQLGLSCLFRVCQRARQQDLDHAIHRDRFKLITSYAHT